MDLQTRFIKNMVSIRKKRKLSQEKLAELSNLHQTYISDVERGVRNPSLKTIEKIANALDVEAYKLFK
ncbi:helix-turn-helix domain-containing protein [Lactobacillus amylovorus]|uniref:helix-turn-helix domain-containing protein n=1 Tax=Lactobacillus amylovorus TaxID=1604 RepID=UPI00232B59E5|nr:helix-turn-helix transcriptional regulator [Lactobacillus amylovorus]MDB6229096.1 helix-turn-helix transcriptional regulator [Lactobacillus amylovorus]